MVEKAKEIKTFKDPWTIIYYPLLTEKAISKVETENRLIFIVDRSANKKQIKWAIENALAAKVDKIQTTIDSKGRKKAFIKFAKDVNAVEIATRLGML